MTKHSDAAFMEMAYGLARQAKGRTHPNPHVGAVIVNKGRIVGWGFHSKAGEPHAEALALKKAGSQASGSTIYVTLEPCIHWGRTPPCVEALLKSEVSRVVVSALDPNPRVFRRGIEKLRREGVEVSHGLMKEKNDSLNEVYNRYITSGRPFVTVKAAVSLDGKLASRTGDAKWISSAESRDYVHILRGESDAILVGIDTIIRDDPRLTIRHPLWKDKPLTRVVLDSRLRLPMASKILQTLDGGPVLIYTGPEISSEKAEALNTRGIGIVSVPALENRLNLEAVLTDLARREISSLLVEGGSRVLTSFFEESLVDKLVLIQAPLLIGGTEAPALYRGRGLDPLGEALRLTGAHLFRVGEDTITEGYL